MAEKEGCARRVERMFEPWVEEWVSYVDVVVVRGVEGRGWTYDQAGAAGEYHCCHNCESETWLSFKIDCGNAQSIVRFCLSWPNNISFGPKRHDVMPRHSEVK